MYIKAFVVAVTVGSILLVINQFDALFGQSPIRKVPALLTYCVPFLVFVLDRRSKDKRTTKN